MIIVYLSFALFVAIFLYLLTYRSKSESEYDKKIAESLEDEYIIDPETGAKLTLEEAESGHWISHDNEYRTTSNSEIENKLTDEEKQVEIAINYLRESKFYKKVELSQEQISKLSKTKILSKYDNWTYSSPYIFEGGILISPAPELYGQTYYEDDYIESQLMFWLKMNSISGHYYLREKSAVEKIFDKLKRDDDLNLIGYESFTFKKSYDVIKINKLLEVFESQKDLEIEIDNDNLFIKTTKLISLKDILGIENVIKTLGNNI